LPVTTTAADAVLLFDGVFLLRPELIDRWDLRIFVSAAFEETLARARIRDLAPLGSAARVEQRFRNRYLPSQQHYFDTPTSPSGPPGKSDHTDQWHQILTRTRNRRSGALLIQPLAYGRQRRRETSGMRWWRVRSAASVKRPRPTVCRVIGGSRGGAICSVDAAITGASGLSSTSRPARHSIRSSGGTSGGSRS
jgi:hypothetical protein